MWTMAPLTQIPPVGEELRGDKNRRSNELKVKSFPPVLHKANIKRKLRVFSKIGKMKDSLGVQLKYTSGPDSH